jgi:hypothetical protein
LRNKINNYITLYLIDKFKFLTSFSTNHNNPYPQPPLAQHQKIFFSPFSLFPFFTLTVSSSIVHTLNLRTTTHFKMGKGKPRGLNSARKLRTHRREK